MDVPRYAVVAPLPDFEGDIEAFCMYAGESCSRVNDILHPANEALGNLTRARDVPVYLVHGALDFLFPVETARFARDTLAAAGAALEYREFPDLSHTYPRSENPRILSWFEALPCR